MNSPKRKPVLFYVFLVISGLHLLGFIIDNGSLRVFTKPLLLISLFAFYLASVLVKNKIYVIALFLSFLGDVFLISDSELNFMLGLSSFLLSHLMYIFLVVRQLKVNSLKGKLIATVPFIGIFIALILFLKDNLGVHFIPVVIYGFVISTFGAVSFLNYIVYRTKPSKDLLFGALFFIVSDSVLAINKFHGTNYWFPIIVMITYIAAQYLICQFVIKSGKEKS